MVCYFDIVVRIIRLNDNSSEGKKLNIQRLGRKAANPGSFEFSTKDLDARQIRILRSLKECAYVPQQKADHYLAADKISANSTLPMAKAILNDIEQEGLNVFNSLKGDDDYASSLVRAQFGEITKADDQSASPSYRISSNSLSGDSSPRQTASAMKAALKTLGASVEPLKADELIQLLGRISVQMTANPLSADHKLLANGIKNITEAVKILAQDIEAAPEESIPYATEYHNRTLFQD